jgi:hypothetical protein
MHFPKISVHSIDSFVPDCRLLIIPRFSKEFHVIQIDREDFVKKSGMLERR